MKCPFTRLIERLAGMAAAIEILFRHQLQRHAHDVARTAAHAAFDVLTDLYFELGEMAHLGMTVWGKT